MDADFSGIKYNVTEGDLHATLEITKKNDMYINGKLVEYNEGEVEKIDYTIPDFSSIASGLPPVLNVITGVPQAKDSILVVGKLSSIVGFKNTSAIV